MTSDGAVHTRAQDLPRLTSLRAFAAIGVFGVHAQTSIRWELGSKLFGLGYAGVGFFFILSGFILTWSTRPGGPARDFYCRRFARIYPAHLVTALIAGLAWGFGTAWSTVGNLLLIQAWDVRDSVHYGLNGASWSLSCEAFFYLIWPITVVYAVRRRANFAATSVLLFFAGSLIVALSLGNDAYVHASYVNPVIRVGEFLVGIALAVYFVERGQSHRVPVPIGLAVFAASWELCRIFIEAKYPLPDFALFPSFVLLIWVGAQADVAKVRGLLTQPWMVYGGQVSFCFYLVHQFAIAVVVEQHIAASGPVLFVLAFLLSCVFAAALHHLVELPGQKYLSRGKRSRVTA